MQIVVPVAQGCFGFQEAFTAEYCMISIEDTKEIEGCCWYVGVANALAMKVKLNQCVECGGVLIWEVEHSTDGNRVAGGHDGVKGSRWHESGWASVFA